MELTTIGAIQEEKDREQRAAQLKPLDPETKKLAEHKRFTFDVINVPTDPLR